MDHKLLATVFAAVFVAELGDKTQLATLLFAADKEAGLGERTLHLVAGTGFIGIGIWTLLRS